MPASCFAAELISAYPDAKVILSVRNSVEEWHESVVNTVYFMRSRLWFMQPGVLSEIFVRVMRIPSYILMRKRMFQCFFEDDFERTGDKVYEKHMETVKSLVPAEKLLVFNPKEGWEPLCRFLGKDVPEGKPFPKLNDRAQFMEAVGKMFENTKERRHANRVRAFVFGLIAIGFGMLMWQGNIRK